MRQCPLSRVMWDSELYCTCLLSITESCVAADSQIDAAWHTAASVHFGSGTPRSVSFGTQFLVTQLLKEQKVIPSWALFPPHGFSLRRSGFPTYLCAYYLVTFEKSNQDSNMPCLRFILAVSN